MCSSISDHRFKTRDSSARCTECGKTRYEAESASSASSDEHGVGITTDGHLGLGIGGGLAIDLSDGSVGIKLGGIIIP